MPPALNFKNKGDTHEGVCFCMPVTVNCAWCGKGVETFPSRIKRYEQRNSNFYCSAECKKEYWHKHRIGKNNPKSINSATTVQCTQCGKEYNLPNWHATRKGGHFCSKKCKATWMGISFSGEGNPGFKKESHVDIRCPCCGKIFSTRKSQIERFNNNYCSRACSDSANLRSNTEPELFIRNFLQLSNISFEQQKVIANKFRVDFLLPDYQIIIEAQGDYWHANPLKYEAVINKIQLKNTTRDKSKYNYLTKCGYTVFGIWENDIKEDIQKAMKPVLKYIETGEKPKITGFRFLYNNNEINLKAL